ncbi:MAG: hypothetical protein M3405_05200 [Acidobacteriota bacterium]|nr:hypothetical protein [Acidobacteriota bacterium]
MMQTYEAVIDEKGKIHLLESINLKNVRRVFITILPNETKTNENQVDVTNLGEILDDDLENARKEISQTFLNAIENSSKELERN